MNERHYDQLWVIPGGAVQALLRDQGYSEFMRETRDDGVWALMCKRKPETRLNTAADFEAMREARRKRAVEAEARMKAEIAAKLAEGTTKSRRQRHRERLERQGDRA